MGIEIQVVLSEGATPPQYATEGSAGLDLSAHLAQPLVLQPGQRARVPTGVRLAIPEGFEGQVRGRSGLADRHGIGLVNAPGTIDSDYRGEIQVLLINWGTEPVRIENGERVAQLVIAPVARVHTLQVEELEATERGCGGFGHTGI